MLSVRATFANLWCTHSQSGTVIQKLTKRKGEMRNYQEQGDRVRLTFEMPSRGLLGYPSEFKNETSGQGYAYWCALTMP